MNDYDTKKIIECKKCAHSIDLNLINAFWDETGYGYSTKLCVCPECGSYVVIKYEEDNWLNDLAEDYNNYERDEY